MPTSPETNPNNKKPQPSYNTKPTNYQAFFVNTIEINDMHLYSGRELYSPSPPTITEHLNILSRRINMKNRRKRKML